MVNVYVLATLNQRKNAVKKYEFWKKNITENYEIDGVLYTIYFFKYTFEQLKTLDTKSLNTEILRVENLLTKSEIYSIIPSNEVEIALGSRLVFDKIIISPGLKILRSILPKILDTFLSQNKNSFAFYDVNMSLSTEIIANIARNSRKIIVITDKDCKKLADNILENYGMIIDVLPSTAHNIDIVDVGIIVSGKFKFNKDVEVVNLTVPKGKWLEFVGIKPLKTPFAINQYELIDTLSQQ